MKENEAINLIENTFNNNFDENKYKFFIRNLFKNVDESQNFSYSGAYIPDAYKEHVKSYKRIGKYITAEENEIDLIIVNLKKDISLERARTMQRNFIAWYLKNRGEKDSSIVAYYTDDIEDWRFSFIKSAFRAYSVG